MAAELTLAYPGDLDTLTGGYIYDKRMLAELEALGWRTHRLSLDVRFPNVDQDCVNDTVSQLAQVARSHILVIDGLALGALGKQAEAIREVRPFVALVHHPLALESGIEPARAHKLHESERQALAHAQHVIVTSEVTRQTLINEFAVCPEDITVIEPGVDRPDTAKHATARQTNQSVRLLSVGAIVPRKGFDILISALGQIKDLDWRLVIVGDKTRSPACTTQVQQLIAQFEIASRVDLIGTQPTLQLAKQYEDADLFVLASHYEGYGMAYTEALAWGLPVVGTDGGAAAQTLNTQAARIVPVGDVQALAATLRALIADGDQRQRMRLAACEYAKQLPSWALSGQKLDHALRA